MDSSFVLDVLKNDYFPGFSNTHLNGIVAGAGGRGVVCTRDWQTQDFGVKDGIQYFGVYDVGILNVDKPYGIDAPAGRPNYVFTSEGDDNDRLVKVYQDMQFRHLKDDNLGDSIDASGMPSKIFALSKIVDVHDLMGNMGAELLARLKTLEPGSGRAFAVEYDVRPGLCDNVYQYCFYPRGHDYRDYVNRHIDIPHFAETLEASISRPYMSKSFIGGGIHPHVTPKIYNLQGEEVMRIEHNLRSGSNKGIKI